MHVMRMFAVAALLAGLVGCGGVPPPTITDRPSTDPPPSPAATESAGADGVDGLIEALGGASGGVREVDTFAADPLANEGVLVCLGEEPLNVYVFSTPEEALARAQMIDPRDPTNVGTAIIEWAGEPKFWLHERVIVLYLGTDPEVEQALLDTLGQPFAFGQGRPPLPGPADPC